MLCRSNPLPYDDDVEFYGTTLWFMLTAALHKSFHSPLLIMWRRLLLSLGILSVCHHNGPHPQSVVAGPLRPFSRLDLFLSKIYMMKTNGTVEVEIFLERSLLFSYSTRSSLHV